MDKNEFCKKKAYFPTNLTYLFFTNAQKPKFVPFLRIYCDLSLSLSFFLSFLLYWWFCCALYRLSFARNCGWLTFQEKGKLNFQRVVCKQRNWQCIFPQNVTFFVSVTLSRLFRISKTRYRWKDISLLTLLLTNLLT